MKKLLTIILLFPLISSAQSGFNYQGIIKDANGAVISNTSIGLRFSIVYDSTSGTAPYVELHTVTTTANGLVNLVVGTGTATTGSFSDIDWSRASIFLKREVDTAGSGSYTDFGTTMLYSVPKANYSSSTQGLSYNSGKVSITHLNVSNTITATAFVGDGSGLTGVNTTVNSTSFKDQRNNIVIGTTLNSNSTNNTGIAIGVNALVSNTSGDQNHAVGYAALSANTTGIENVAFGYAALTANTSGEFNVGIGNHSLQGNTNGKNNTSVGYGSLTSNTTGNYNVSIGTRNLNENDSGSKNTSIGENALQNNISGSNNTASGFEALKLNETGEYNTANGYQALNDNVSGDNNVAVGSFSLTNNTGYGNTAVGRGTLNNNINGNYNTVIGFDADVGSSSLTNATAIGYQAQATTDNVIQLGNADVTYLYTTGSLAMSSDRRLKEDIVRTPYGLEEVLKLNPVSYQFISNGLGQLGFIAQEVQKLVPEVVVGTEGDIEKGEILRISYSNLIPVLTKAIQQQQEMIDQLLKRIDALEKDK